jgi:hypothetical protein
MSHPGAKISAEYTIPATSPHLLCAAHNRKIGWAPYSAQTAIIDGLTLSDRGR